MKIVALASLVALLASASAVAGEKAKAPAPGRMAAMEGQTPNPTALVGHMVYDNQHEIVGQIQTVIRSQDQLKAVMTVTAETDLQGKDVLVPLSALKQDKDKRLTLNMTASDLSILPSYSGGD